MAKQGIPILSLSVRATGATTANRFVTALGVQAPAGGNALGIGRQTAVIGDMITVDVMGTQMAEAGAVVSAGATIGSDASGRAITWASGAKIGVALESASASGQLFEILLIQNAA